MSGVHGSSEAAEQLRGSIINIVQTLRREVENQAENLKALAADCRDDSYTAMEHCTKSIILQINQLLPDISSVCKQLEEYRDFLDGMQDDSNSASGSVVCHADASTPASATGFVSRALQETQQEQVAYDLDGRSCMIFDHPFDHNSQRICKQGSAFPNGPQNTCGCCSAGTIVNKAGGNTSEHFMVSYALDHGLCDKDGFTSAATIAKLMSDCGVPSSVTSRKKLSDLADAVERGHGVVIAVDARRFDSTLYRNQGGHALVLDSVIRDAKTNKILEYIVVDSNGATSESAVRRIDARTLENAFKALGRQSITTNNIIW